MWIGSGVDQQNVDLGWNDKIVDCQSPSPSPDQQNVDLQIWPSPPPPTINKMWIWGGLTKLLIVDLGQINIDHLLPDQQNADMGGLTKLLIVNLGQIDVNHLPLPWINKMQICGSTPLP